MWTLNPVRVKRYLGYPLFRTCPARGCERRQEHPGRRACGHRLPRSASTRGCWRDSEAGTSRKPRGITAPTRPSNRLESPGFSRGEDVNQLNNECMKKTAAAGMTVIAMVSGVARYPMSMPRPIRAVGPGIWLRKRPVINTGTDTAPKASRLIIQYGSHTQVAVWTIARATARRRGDSPASSFTPISSDATVVMTVGVNAMVRNRVSESKGHFDSSHPRPNSTVNTTWNITGVHQVAARHVPASSSRIRTRVARGIPDHLSAVTPAPADRPGER